MSKACQKATHKQKKKRSIYTYIKTTGSRKTSPKKIKSNIKFDFFLDVVENTLPGIKNNFQPLASCE